MQKEISTKENMKENIVFCETFFPENQLNGSNKCPDCGKELTVLKEESYFFKMSKYADALLLNI